MVQVTIRHRSPRDGVTDEQTEVAGELTVTEPSPAGSHPAGSFDLSSITELYLGQTEEESLEVVGSVSNPHTLANNVELNVLLAGSRGTPARSDAGSVAGPGTSATVHFTALGY